MHPIFFGSSCDATTNIHMLFIQVEQGHRLLNFWLIGGTIRFPWTCKVRDNRFG
jgi:hypothetical protein